MKYSEFLLNGLIIFIIIFIFIILGIIYLKDYIKKRNNEQEKDKIQY